MNADDIISAILAERRAQGLTQSRVAERAQISRRSMIAMEAGKHDIGLRKLIRILDSLGMTISLRKDTARPTESELADLFKEDDE